MTRFIGMVTPDPVEGGYTVTVLGLSGLVTGGDTREEALANAREAIELYFEGETPENLAANGVQTDYLHVTVDARVPV